MKINVPSPNMHNPGFLFATFPTSNSMLRISAYDLASEFGQMQISIPRARFPREPMVSISWAGRTI